MHINKNILMVNVKLNDKLGVFADAEYCSRITKTSPYEILTNFSKVRAKIIIK